MQYSALCDTNLVAYLAYVASVNCNGGSLEQPLRISGGSCDNTSSDSSDNHGSGVVGVFRGLLSEARRGVDEMDPDSAFGGIRGRVDSIAEFECQRNSIANVGVAGSDDGDRHSCVGHGVCTGRVRKAECGTKFLSVDSNAEVVNSKLGKRAKKTAREARRKARRSVDVDSGVELSSDDKPPVDLFTPEWRRKGLEKVGVKSQGWQGSGSGFWNSCSDVVRQELIDSKAMMHVAENKRKAAEARNRVDYLESPRAIADQVVKLANQLEKQSGLAQSQAIAGWAQTVLSSSAESVAKSAPSSVPSFETYITDRSERERIAAEEAVARSKKMDEEAEALRVKEEEARFQKVLDERVREQVQVQVKQKIVEFEKQLRQSHTVIKKDMRTGRRDPELEHLQQIAGRHPVMATIRRV